MPRLDRAWREEVRSFHPTSWAPPAERRPAVRAAAAQVRQRGRAQPRHLRGAPRHDLRRQPAVAQLQRRVARRQERQELRVHRAPGRRLDHAAQPVALRRREAHLDRDPDDVPGDILAADEVVPDVVIKSVGLEQAPVGRQQPLPGVRPVVRLDPAHPALEPVESRRPPVELPGQVLAQSQPGVETRHLQQPRQRRAPPRRRRRKVPRPERQIAPDLRQEPVAVAEPPVQ
jgi:hypothetical protein